MRVRAYNMKPIYWSMLDFVFRTNFSTSAPEFLIPRKSQAEFLVGLLLQRGVVL